MGKLCKAHTGSLWVRRQDNTYHGVCYTSRVALAEMRNSSTSPPCGSKVIYFCVVYIQQVHLWESCARHIPDHCGSGDVHGQGEYDWFL